MPSSRPLVVAVIGSGPSGLYAADSLTKTEPPATVDVFDRLPAPFGLVRYGVAPDHPNIKQIADTLARILAKDGVRFLGNVGLGVDVSLAELAARYDAVVIATGCPHDAPLDLPGADLNGSFGSADFVAWYDGHPDAVRSWPLEAREVAILGVGNVALDLARILTKPASDLGSTDIPGRVLEDLQTSAVTDVHIFGRRGPAQVRFSPLELKEIGEIPDVDVVVDPEGFDWDAASEAAVEASRQTRQVVDLLRSWTGREPTGARRRIHIHLLLSPVAILDDGNGKVGGIRLERTRLRGDGSVEGTGQVREFAVQAVFRAIGYRGMPIPGVPFDARSGLIPNAAGRVLDVDGLPVPGLYTTGWIKRGPSGLIGYSKKDSQETVDRILEDAENLISSRDGRQESVDPRPIEEILGERGTRVVQWRGWEALDAWEKMLGQAVGRERVKIADREEMVRVALEAPMPDGDRPGE